MPVTKGSPSFKSADTTSVFLLSLIPVITSTAFKSP